MGSRALRLGLVAMPVLAACVGPGGSGSSSASRAPASAIPAPADFPLLGAWTTVVTKDDLRVGGITDPGLLNENSGHYTWAFEADGTWRTVMESLDGSPIMNPVFSGTYIASGNVVIATTTFPEAYRDAGLHYGYELHADGSVDFELRDPPDPILPLVVESHPWQRANG